MTFISSIFSTKISPNHLLVATSAYIALVLNIPFLARVFRTVTNLDDYSVLFLISVPLVLICFIVLFHSLFAFAGLLKPMLIVSVIVSSLLFYATFQYGIIFDHDMVQNVVETDQAEALMYVNLHAVIFFSLFGLLPSWLIYRTKLIKLHLAKAITRRLSLIVLTAVIMSTLIAVFYVNFASIARNNKELAALITPFKLYDSGIKYVFRSVAHTTRPFQLLDASPSLIANKSQQTINVLMLGETARAQNFSLNGYAKPTNKYTEGSGIISFTDVSSCGTATAVSLPCMFSKLKRRDFDKYLADSQQNVVDMIQSAGVDVTWIDNNNGNCKGVCARVTTITIDPTIAHAMCDGEYCFDEILLEYLDEKLGTIGNQNTLIVLHMIGSHGPTYYRRYPSQHREFVPDCQQSDIQNCSRLELTNTYDNTILYTDYVLSKVIERLQLLSKQKDVQSTMFYISDHGESLGESGVYLHGFPYVFAPDEQTHVPMLLWQSDNVTGYNKDCIKTITASKMSHDNLFDTMLGMNHVSSKVYDPSQDVLEPCRILAN